MLGYAWMMNIFLAFFSLIFYTVTNMDKMSKSPQLPLAWAEMRQAQLAEKRAEALRANLKKRKEQSTARTEQELQSKK